MLIFLTASSLVKSNAEINRKLFAQQCLKHLFSQITKYTYDRTEHCTKERRGALEFFCIKWDNLVSLLQI